MTPTNQKSIETVEKIIGANQLSQEQENIVIRLAVTSALKVW